MKSKFNLSKYIKPLDAIVLGIVIVLRIVYYHFGNAICRTVDSVEYIRVNGMSWLFGDVDRYRLPVYPLLIDVCSKLFGDRGLWVVCLIQLAASLLSLVALYFALKKLTDRSYIYLPITVLYGLSVTVLGWDKVILTESLSLSLTVFMLFGLIYYLKDNKLRYLAVAVLAVGIGAFMRTVFAIYAGVIFGFLIIRLIFTGKKSSEEKKLQRITDAKGLIFAVIPILLLLGYGAMFSAQHGAFTLSDSGLGQQLSIVLEQGYYLDSSDEEIKEAAEDILSGKMPQSYYGEINSLIEKIYGDGLTEAECAQIKEDILKYMDANQVLDEKYVERLDEIYAEIYGDNAKAVNYGEAYRARCYIMHNFDRERVSEFVAESKRANFKEYLISLRYAPMAGFDAGYERLKDGNISTLTNVFVKVIMPSVDIYLLQGILIGCVELAIFFVILIKKKYPHWIHLGCATVIIATGLLSVFGTNAEYARTALTMYPVLYVVFAMWAEGFVKLIIKKELGAKIESASDSDKRTDST